MATFKVRYLVARDGRSGKRHYWQPSAELARAGWRAETLDADPARAIARAEELNRQVDAWRSGEGVPAPGTPGAPRTRRSARTAGSVGELIDEYRASRFYRDRARATRKLYDWALSLLDKWAGDRPRAAVTKRDAQKLYEKLAAVRLPKANAVMTIGGILFSRGASLGLCAHNPFADPVLTPLAKRGIIYPRAAIAAFVAAADAHGYSGVADAIVLDEWIGQRPGDLIKLPRSLLPTGASQPDVVLSQGKTDAAVILPVRLVPALVARLQLMAARPAPIAATTAIVNHATGRPYSLGALERHFAEVRAIVARQHPRFATDYVPRGTDLNDPQAFTVETMRLQLRHLRNTAITRLAEAGCASRLIATISGHSEASVAQILETYVVRTRPAAALAFTTRLEHEAKAQG